MLNCILLTTDAVGGIWRYSMELARSLAARQISVVLAVLGPAPDPVQVYEASNVPNLRLVLTGFPLDWLTETSQQIEASAHALAKLARRADAAIIQLHTPALVGRVSWPAPVVAVVHSCVGTWWRAVRGGPMPPNLACQSQAAGVGIARADSVIAPSASFADVLREYYCPARPIEIVRNARTPLTGAAKRQRQGLTVGRLWDEGKNVTALDTAVGNLNWPVLAAGPTVGSDGSRVACRHLRMLGPLHDTALADQYAEAAIFVSVSLYEPFGLAVLEAAQAGCALLLSDIPTFRELWNGSAIFIPPENPPRIAAALQHLFQNTELCKRQGAAAKRRAEWFNVPHMVDAMIRVYARLLPSTSTAA